MERLGKFILAVLKEKKKSLRWLGRESGVSNAYLSQLTRGLFKATPEILIRLTPALGVTREKLFAEAGWLEPESGKKGKK
jgi:transcriptional regulator with XRE-family HTH domain